MNTTVPSSIGGTNVAMAWPNMWLSGNRFRKRIGKNGLPYVLYFRTSRSTGMMLARTLRCVRTTPLGSAVAPEVKMISTVSSRVTGTGRKAAASSARKSMSENFQVADSAGLHAFAEATAGLAIARWSLRATGRQASELHVITDQQQLRVDDACDGAEKFVRRAVVDRHRDRSVQQTSPQRDDPLRAVFAPEDNFVAFHDARALQARGKASRGGGGFCVRIRTCAISVVVDEKFTATSGDIVEEIE